MLPERELLDATLRRLETFVAAADARSRSVDGEAPDLGRDGEQLAEDLVVLGFNPRSVVATTLLLQHPPSSPARTLRSWRELRVSLHVLKTELRVRADGRLPLPAPSGPKPTAAEQSPERRGRATFGSVYRKRRRDGSLYTGWYVRHVQDGRRIEQSGFETQLHAQAYLDQVRVNRSLARAMGLPAATDPARVRETAAAIHAPRLRTRRERPLIIDGTKQMLSELRKAGYQVRRATLLKALRTKAIEGTVTRRNGKRRSYRVPLTSLLAWAERRVAAGE